MGLLRRRGAARAAAALLALLLLPGPAPAAEEPAPAAQEAEAPEAAQAGELPAGEEIARRINARDEGRQSSRRLVMELIAEGGFTRTRETRLFRRNEPDGGKKLVIFYESPRTLEGTAFLAHDHAEAERDDDFWLYLPAIRKVRRIASSDRGRAFLATDLSYEDVKLETKVGADDYRWRTLGEDALQDGTRVLRVEAVPVDEDTAWELGYGRVVLKVDPRMWLVRRAEYEDPAGRRLKSARVEDVRKVDGIWTVHEIDVRNHRTGHRTRFLFSEVDYARELPEYVFTPRGLRRGPP